MQKNYDVEKTANGLALVFITIIDAFLLLGYVANYLNKHIALWFMCVILCSVVISMVADYAIYFRKKDAQIFKYVSVAGFVVVYTLALFGGKNDVVFTMIFPIIIVYILYFDYQLIFWFSVVAGAANLLDIGYAVLIMKHMHSGGEINGTILLLQGAATIVALTVLCCTTRVSNRNNALKIASINEEKEKGAELLKDVLAVAKAVRKNSTEAMDYIEDLGKDVDDTTTAMEEIAMGNNNNAENIEKQTVMTGNIQNMIEDTKQMSDEMMEFSKHSEVAVQGGRESVTNLKENSKKTEEANRQVEISVQNFIQNVNEVQEIVSQIFSISDQTNLLALNASIESARAGEAGKGFSVVAEEIRKLAEETRVLTEKISSIVTVLQTNADQAIKTVDNVLETAQTEHDLINMTNDRFNEIGESVDGLNRNVEQIYRKIEDIMKANNVIVDSISQISAVSEEVAASTQQTVDKSAETRGKAATAGKLMEELVGTVSSIDKYLED